MDYVIPPASIPAVPVADGSDSFPARRIHRLGHNRAAHARAMGSDPDGFAFLRVKHQFFHKP